MSDKPSKNPFINMANAANAARAVAGNPKSPAATTAQVQQAYHAKQVNNNKPAKKSTGRGR